MKKLAALIALTLLLTAPCAVAEDTPAAEAPAYEAVVALDCSIRKAPDSDYRVCTLKQETKVDVYEYGDTWCRVGYREYTGYMKTRWLWGFRSLNAKRYAVPGAPQPAGVVTLTEDTWIEGGKFSGLSAQAGSVVCVNAETADGYTLPVWRGEGAIGLHSGAMTAFGYYDEAAPGDIIGGFTTFYNERTGGELAQARAYNIALACERIDGTTLAAGESFSFNVACAPYKRSNGYKMAPNISKEGKGYGGGVCQVTTTLYNALLSLPLQIERWTVHRKIGVQYVPQFFDAAVGSYSDLVFTNTLPYPIAISAQPQNGVVTVLLLRAAE